MKKALLAGLLLMGLVGKGMAAELSWRDFINDAEGNVVKFTALKSIAPSYFYNAFSGRSEIGATTELFWVGSFVSADAGYSVPNAEDKNVGTVILGGNLHIDRLIAKSFPETVDMLNSAIPDSMERFFHALNIGLYVGHDTTNSELAGGVYSSLVLRF